MKKKTKNKTYISKQRSCKSEMSKLETVWSGPQAKVSEIVSGL